MEGYNPPIITEEDDGTGASPVSGVVVAGGDADKFLDRQ